jgi:hypothetical protein
MKKGEGYDLETAQIRDAVQFKFTSEGNKGAIHKIIEFSYLGQNSWNLGFGDIKGDDWEDNIISNNNDFRKVLQTVTNAVHRFFELYPDHQIQIIPLDYQRKLLYNRVFQQRWLEIEPLFDVNAAISDDEKIKIESYSPTKIFDAFVVSQKTKVILSHQKALSLEK